MWGDYSREGEASPYKNYIDNEIPMLENMVNFTGSKMEKPRRRYLVTAFLKNLFWMTEKSQPLLSIYLYKSFSMSVRFEKTE
jgi:hypothetical protein